MPPFGTDLGCLGPWPVHTSSAPEVRCFLQLEYVTAIFYPAHLENLLIHEKGVSVLTDLVFALLPIPMLWNVQLNWKVKSAIAGVLSLGVL